MPWYMVTLLIAIGGFTVVLPIVMMVFNRDSSPRIDRHVSTSRNRSAETMALFEASWAQQDHSTQPHSTFSHDAGSQQHSLTPSAHDSTPHVPEICPPDSASTIDPSCMDSGSMNSGSSGTE
jgi:hypothetical protein